jgi:superoxide dismutase, Cu-Zn family
MKTPHLPATQPRARTRRAATLAAALLATTFATGCGAQRQAATPNSAAPVTAVAKLLTPQGQLMGQAIFTQTQQGVQIALTTEGLTPGLHGYHIHTNGACAPGPDAATGRTVDFGAAGGHFDPGESGKHGQPGAPAHMNHAGELPNLQADGAGKASQADGAGKASLNYINEQVSLLPGKTSVLGRTLVIHANPDDYQTNPAGNSGPRVLCGVIERSQLGNTTTG